MSGSPAEPSSGPGLATRDDMRRISSYDWQEPVVAARGQRSGDGSGRRALAVFALGGLGAALVCAAPAAAAAAQTQSKGQGQSQVRSQSPTKAQQPIPARTPLAASTTAFSTVSKTGTDQQTGSTATGGGSAGSAHPGDTVNWVLGYQNNTGKTASVTLNDPITAGHSLVTGSLKQPPGWNITAAGTTVSGTAASVPATSSAALSFQAGSNAINQPSGGDGFNVVIDPQSPQNVYTLFHHNLPSLACVNKSGGSCAGWSAGVLFYDNANPTGPLLTNFPASSPYQSNQQNFATLDPATGRAYEVAYDGVAQTANVLCLDSRTRTGCGLVQSTPTSVFGPEPGAQLSDGWATGLTQATDGLMYWMSYAADGSAGLHCFDPASNTACASGNGLALMPAGTALINSQRGNTQSFGSKYVFTVLATAAGGAAVQCYDTSAHALCAGWPASGLVSTGTPSGELGPLTDASGLVSGICSVGQAGVNTACWTVGGASATVPAIYTQPVGTGFSYDDYGNGYYQEIARIGSRVYFQQQSSGSLLCYNFGTSAACAGYTYTGPNLDEARNYTVVPDAANPTCVWANGDTGQMIPVNAVTGGVGCSVIGSVTASPQSDYCDGTTHPVTWGGISVAAPPSSQFGQFVVTVMDAEGKVVTDTAGTVWSNHLVPSTTNPIDLSNILYGPAVVMSGNTYDTTTLTVSVGFNNVTAAFNPPPAATLTWSSDNVYQVCFQTKIDNTCVGSTVANSATFVTDATAAGGATDGPGGNGSGTASFTVTPDATTCELHIVKSENPPEVGTGHPVTYTISVTNTGTADYTAANPAVITDDMTSSLTEATYNNDAATTPAGTGSLTFTSPTLTWTGPLAAGATVSISYSLTPNSGSGGSQLGNTVSTNATSNCPVGSTDPDCTTAEPVTPQIEFAKSVSTPGPVHSGDVVIYHVVISTPDGTPYTGATFSDNLAGVLDVAHLDGSPTATAGSASVTGTTLTWNGDVPANGSVTVTYQVTVN